MRFLFGVLGNYAVFAQNPEKSLFRQKDRFGLPSQGGGSSPVWARFGEVPQPRNRASQGRLGTSPRPGNYPLPDPGLGGGNSWVRTGSPTRTDRLPGRVGGTPPDRLIPPSRDERFGAKPGKPGKPGLTGPEHDFRTFRGLGKKSPKQRVYLGHQKGSALE